MKTITLGLIFKKQPIKVSFIYFLRYTKVPRQPVISSCGTTTKKISEFLDNHLQSLMKQRETYEKQDILQQNLKLQEKSQKELF